MLLPGTTSRPLPPKPSLLLLNHPQLSVSKEGHYVIDDHLTSLDTLTLGSVMQFRSPIYCLRRMHGLSEWSHGQQHKGMLIISVPVPSTTKIYVVLSSG
jgi:hypothetical protein